jgi:threo-3-hydroxy-L-aspartate ammonia-lyase
VDQAYVNSRQQIGSGLENSPILPVTFADVRAAQQTLSGLAQTTPVLRSEAADARAHAQLYFKCESLQRTGSFKFRGAYNAISRALQRSSAPGVAAFSSGNHAQAVAYAARLLGVSATIVMPHDAPAGKRAATESYGAEVIGYDRYRENREFITRELARTRGLELIPPFDHPDVIAGQGTVGLELFQEVEDLDVLVTPLGGGGLLSGCALAAKALNPKCRVVGVEPEAGNDAQQSLRAGRIICIETPRTIADGAQTLSIGNYTFPILQRLVTEILTVSDAQLLEAMRFFLESMKLVVEPTGCLAAAAVLHGLVPAPAQKIGIVLSGGNVDSARLQSLLNDQSS